MTRHVITIEGVPTILPGVRLKPGSLWMKSDKPVPVTTNFDHSSIIGFAKDLERNEETGEVSVDIDFRPGFELPKEEEEDYDFTFMANELLEEQIAATDEDEAYRLILSAKLLQVAMVPKAAIPRRL
jgi:hypothetical protein